MKKNVMLYVALTLSVVFLLYLVAVGYSNSATAGQGWSFLFMKTNKAGHLVISWAMGVSYLIGFIIAGIGWQKEYKKRVKADRDIAGLKTKLGAVEQEKDFYAKKVSILESGINSTAPVDGKKPAPAKKLNKSSMKSIVILLVVLLLTGIALFGWWQFHYQQKKSTVEADAQNTSEIVTKKPAQNN